MTRAARINLWLVVIVLALGALVAWQVRREQAAQEPPLTVLDSAAVGSVRVRCAQCAERHFVRDGARWVMQQPYRLDADQAVVARLLAIASSPVRVRRRVDEFDLARIGLDPPAMYLALDAMSIDVGTADALRGDRYVRIGEVVAMVPDRFSPFLMAAPESELDRHLAPRALELVAVTIDGVATSASLDAWRSAEASALRARDSDQAILDGARRIELSLVDGSRVVYHLSRDADGMLAQREAPALDYLLDARQTDLLFGADGNR